MSKVIGIDLGTANSCVAVLQDGEVVIIPDTEGNRTMPSLFAINANREPIIGWQAQRQADMNRLNTIFAAKRLIGRKYQSREVEEFADKVPYKVISSANGDAWIEVNGDPMSPEEVSSQILLKLKEQAETHYNETISHAVITVPAHFNDAQRQATKDAGRIAGLQVLSIINEPTAAALAYGLDINNMTNTAGGESTDRIIAVFDVGSGTFDVTILQLKNGVFDVLATGGDTYLGGEDFDIAMMNYLIQEFKRSDGVDISRDKSVLQRLKEAGRQAKQDLSTQFSVEVFVPYICKGNGNAAPKDLKITVDRKTFERVCGDLLDRLEGPCLQALADANLKPQDVSDAILVGGMTRMPAIKQRCQMIFGKIPIDTINPDEAVASGAAIQAALLQGVLQGMKLADVTSLSFGIETQGGKMAVLLPRNTKIPAKTSEVVTTSAPSQTDVTIHLLQGESDFVPDNKSLGRFEISGIKPAPRGIPRIEVTLEVDASGIVHISAKDLDSGLVKELQIMNSSGLSDEEIGQKVLDNRKQAAYKQRRAEEEKRLKKIKAGHVVTDDTFGELTNAAKLELKAAIFETQFKLDTEGKRLRGDRRNKLERILAAARATLDTATEITIIQDATHNVRVISEELSGFLEAA